MKIKISELKGAALDWAVARALELDPEISKACEGYDVSVIELGRRTLFSPSEEWFQGGPLLEAALLLTNPHPCGEWSARYSADGQMYGQMFGRTLLIAAMRAIVAAHSDGDTVEVPAELVEDVKQDGGEQWQAGES